MYFQIWAKITALHSVKMIFLMKNVLTTIWGKKKMDPIAKDFGEFEAIVPFNSAKENYMGLYGTLNFQNKQKNPQEKENWNFYQMHYYIDKEIEMKVYEEYIIIDAMGMIGSVGGTLGLFIGFSFSNVINVLIGYLQLFLNKICWKNSKIMDQEMSKTRIGNLTKDAEYQHKLQLMEIKLNKMQKDINDLKQIEGMKQIFTKK